MAYGLDDSAERHEALAVDGILRAVVEHGDHREQHGKNQTGRRHLPAAREVQVDSLAIRRVDSHTVRPVGWRERLACMLQVSPLAMRRGCTCEAAAKHERDVQYFKRH